MVLGMCLGEPGFRSVCRDPQRKLSVPLHPELTSQSSTHTSARVVSRGSAPLWVTCVEGRAGLVPSHGGPVDTGGGGKVSSLL